MCFLCTKDLQSDISYIWYKWLVTVVRRNCFFFDLIENVCDCRGLFAWWVDILTPKWYFIFTKWRLHSTESSSSYSSGTAGLKLRRAKYFKRQSRVQPEDREMRKQVSEPGPPPATAQPLLQKHESYPQYTPKVIVNQFGIFESFLGSVFPNYIFLATDDYRLIMI